MIDVGTLLDGIIIFLSVSTICVAVYAIVKETETDTEAPAEDDTAAEDSVFQDLHSSMRCIFFFG